MIRLVRIFAHQQGGSGKEGKISHLNLLICSNALSLDLDEQTQVLVKKDVSHLVFLL